MENFKAARESLQNAGRRRYKTEGINEIAIAQEVGSCHG
jgi:hypothetical protein